MSEPYFPPPRARREKPTGYRAPAEVTLPVEPPAKIVVQRAELPPDSSSVARRPPATDFVGLGQRERTFWQRHRFFARHPRVVGGFLTVVGGAIVISLVDTLLHGGSYSVRGPMLAGPALCVGLWTLAVGYPLDENGDVPIWYKTGLAASTFIGFGFGAVLLLALLGQSA